MNNTYIELVEQLKKRKIIAFGCGGVFEKFMLRYPSMKDNISFFIDKFHPLQQLHVPNFQFLS